MFAQYTYFVTSQSKYTDHVYDMLLYTQYFNVQRFPLLIYPFMKYQLRLYQNIVCQNIVPTHELLSSMNSLFMKFECLENSSRYIV